MHQPSPNVTLVVPPERADHGIGSLRPLVTLIEYGDFECPNCRMAAPTPRLLLKKFPDALRFIYRHFPLEQAHPHALQAAEASEAAGNQGKFWAMHDLLFENQVHLADHDLARYAGVAGLDLGSYKAEMDDHIYLQKIREHVDGGLRSHIRATPTFFVNGVIQDVSFGMQGLHDAVAEAVESTQYEK